ncbi:hypothetical protein SKAU_G00127260 [Synaphobranchus kaupii]|uniref:Uncharacterized protein n=1 Tax=Synaphobranchus kaupii TaxID=118154 RepID=A0A9Q1FPP8_SYNKA|nr:hypothetical protein SKAU_G00127260 [Synaphobranchus kaupii]
MGGDNPGAGGLIRPQLRAALAAAALLCSASVAGQLRRERLAGPAQSICQQISLAAGLDSREKGSKQDGPDGPTRSAAGEPLERSAENPRSNGNLYTFFRQTAVLREWKILRRRKSAAGPRRAFTGGTVISHKYLQQMETVPHLSSSVRENSDVIQSPGLRKAVASAFAVCRQRVREAEKS